MATTYGYKEIAAELRRRIKGKEWQVGDRIPGISALQEEYGVRSLNVIRRAQALLVEEGLLRTEQGRGVFVASFGTPNAADLLAELDRTRRQLQQTLEQYTAALAAVAAVALEPAERR